LKEAGHIDIETDFSDELLDELVNFVDYLSPDTYLEQKKTTEAFVPAQFSSSPDKIVFNWLKSHYLQQYTEQFLAAGYFDLQIIGKIDAIDLDLIGVVDATHRQTLLNAAKQLSSSTVNQPEADDEASQLEKSGSNASSSKDPEPETPLPDTSQSQLQNLDREKNPAKSKGGLLRSAVGVQTDRYERQDRPLSRQEKRISKRRLSRSSDAIPKPMEIPQEIIKVDEPTETKPREQAHTTNPRVNTSEIERPISSSSSEDGQVSIMDEWDKISFMLEKEVQQKEVEPPINLSLVRQRRDSILDNLDMIDPADFQSRLLYLEKLVLRQKEVITQLNGALQSTRSKLLTQDRLIQKMEQDISHQSNMGWEQVVDNVTSELYSSMAFVYK